MITRVWHGRTKAKDANAYREFLLGEGTTEYREIEENLSISVWEKLDGDVCHFYTVTEWPGIDAVKKFAGEDYQKAKYYPYDNDMLLEFEETVEHYTSHRVSNARIKYFVNQFDQLLSGGSWQGESFEKKLESLGEEDVFEQPVPGVHCIAELIWHCVHWRNVLINRLCNTAHDTSDESNFVSHSSLKTMGWPRLWDLFLQSQRDIRSSLITKADDYLASEYKPGYTMEYLVEGVIQHDIYHLGQIGLIIKINSMKDKT
jgi:uncharacterized damage-inducible protein DinB